MDYINDIFARANMQQIRCFLLNSVESNIIEEKSYIDRLDESFKSTMKIIKSGIPNEEEQRKILDKIVGCQAEVEHVYMEVGMKCGAMLAIQLLSELT